MVVRRASSDQNSARGLQARRRPLRAEELYSWKGGALRAPLRGVAGKIIRTPRTLAGAEPAMRQGAADPIGRGALAVCL